MGSVAASAAPAPVLLLRGSHELGRRDLGLSANWSAGPRIRASTLRPSSTGSTRRAAGEESVPVGYVGPIPLEEGKGDGQADGLGEAEGDGEAEAETEGEGDALAEGEAEGEGVALSDGEAEGVSEGLAEGEGGGDGDGDGTSPGQLELGVGNGLRLAAGLVEGSVPPLE
jgi:hypothetical protein